MYPVPLRFPAPPRLQGDVLAAEIAAAGFRDVSVTLDGEEVCVLGRRSGGVLIDESDRPGIGAVVAAHDGKPTAAQREKAAREQRAAELRAKATLSPVEMAEAVRLLLADRGTRGAP